MSNYLRFIGLDLRTLRPFLKLVFITLVVLMAFSAISFTPNATLIIIALVTVTVMSHLFSQDERLNIFYGLIPITRKDAVIGRYLGLFALAVVTVLIGLVTALAMASFGHTGLDGTGLSALATVAAVLLLLAIQIPIYYRVGYARARFINFALIFVFAFAGYAANSFISAGLGRLAISATGAIGAVLVVSLLLYAGSAALSLRWYQRREL